MKILMGVGISLLTLVIMVGGAIAFEVDMGTLLEGDSTSDDIISLADFNDITAAWGGPSATADLNKDGIVSLIDFNMMTANWGSSSPQEV